MNWYKRHLIEARQIVIPNKDYDKLMELIEKIVKGKRDWTPEELELQQNYPEAIEVVLRKKIKATAFLNCNIIRRI